MKLYYFGVFKMKLIDCKTLLPTLIRYQNDAGDEIQQVVFIDMKGQNVFSTSNELNDVLKQEILNSYVNKPIVRPEMPKNAWNKSD